jgi:hypothetical protein
MTAIVVFSLNHLPRKASSVARFEKEMKQVDLTWWLVFSVGSKKWYSTG